MRKIWRAIACAVAIMISCSTDALANKLELGADWAKLDDKLYVGVHCLVADGSALKLLKIISLPVEVITDVLAKEAVDKATRQVALSEGDSYCIYMNVSQIPGGDLDFDRRELVFDEGKSTHDFVSTWHVAMYEKGVAKAISYETGTCAEVKEGKASGRARCGTALIRGNPNISGFAVCIEPQLPGNKKMSVVIRYGNIAGWDRIQLGGKPHIEPVSCVDRANDFLDKPAKTETPKT